MIYIFWLYLSSFIPSSYQKCYFYVFYFFRHLDLASINFGLFFMHALRIVKPTNET